MSDSASDVLAKWSDFSSLDIRTGIILTAEDFPQAHKPSYLLSIDFGPLGIKKSSAQLTERYTLDDLPGKKVIAVVNFPPKQIANRISECLVLGALDKSGVNLLTTDLDAPNGTRIG